jgi:Protein of unknown function (DUF3313)
MKHNRIVMMTALIATVAVMSACAATKQARSMEDTSPFLGEYRSLLKPGKEGEALLIYRKPNLNISGYKQILLEPVTVWNDPNDKLSGEQHADLQSLADSFYVTLKEKLSKDYEMVETAGPNTIKIQVAIINGEKSKVGLASISKIIPQVRLLNTLWSFASGKPAFTGEVSIEFKFTDAATGELLAAGADERVGTLKLFDATAFGSWGDVKNAFTYWGDFTVYRLCQLRGGSDCVKPKA